MSVTAPELILFSPEGRLLQAYNRFEMWSLQS